MARESSINQEQVNAAADAIRASGIKPTARAIRDHLGTGSMATVLKFLQVWQAGQVKPATQDVTLPAQLQRYLVDFVAQEVAIARVGLESDLVSAQQSQADLIAESERQAATIEAQTETLEATLSEKAELAGKLAQVQADLARASEDVAQDRQAAEFARTELAKAQLRLEAMPRLEADLERLRGELAIQQTGRVAAEQQAAVLAAKLESEEARCARYEAHINEMVAQSEKASAVRMETLDALSNERLAVQACNARLESAARELATAQKAVQEARAEAKKAGEETAELRGRLAGGKK